MRVAGEVGGRVAPRAAAEERRVGAARPLDEHLLDAADTLRVALGGDALDDLDEALDALALDVLRTWSGRSAASVPRRGEKTNVKALS